ncbi:mariner transposase [Elysia marginata]|uniref:Mariner transposase n=1 Tax=Elysia marginata TaxID=1093978 RepID=A0AAV4IBE3_9GAST|nr:mariner transposase [Elysia marginata]
MATAFWDTQGVILVDFLSRGETVSSDFNIDTLKRLWARILRVRPDTSIRTKDTTASFGGTTLPYPSYSPDLSSSDYRLFGPMKQNLRMMKK